MLFRDQPRPRIGHGLTTTFNILIRRGVTYDTVREWSMIFEIETLYKEQPKDRFLFLTITLEIFKPQLQPQNLLGIHSTRCFSKTLSLSQLLLPLPSPCQLLKSLSVPLAVPALLLRAPEPANRLPTARPTVHISLSSSPEPLLTHSGFTVVGACPNDPASVRCCIKKSCSTSSGSGTCLNTSSGCSGGSFISGACPGGSDIKCCVKSTSSGGFTGAQVLAKAKTQAGVAYSWGGGGCAGKSKGIDSGANSKFHLPFIKPPTLF